MDKNPDAPAGSPRLSESSRHSGLPWTPAAQGAPSFGLKFFSEYSDSTQRDNFESQFVFLYNPPQPTKVRKRTQGSTNNARTDEVFEHVIAAALPPNPKALARVRELVHGAADRSEIAKTLTSDPGLALHYLINARSVLNLDQLPEDALAPIFSMTEEQLKSLFDVSAAKISKHKISEAGPPQLLRLQHTFIASQAAANLSRQFDIDEGKAFSLVQVSQSALNLLAWSYPSQFHKALFNQKRFKASIDDSLNALVGIKPENIVNKLARKIGLPSSLLMDLQLSQQQKKSATQLPEHPSPLVLAQLGDLLAKANDKEHFPEAFQLWENVEKQLDQRGLENPKDEIHEELKNFVKELGAETSLPYQSSIFVTQSREQVVPHEPVNVQKLNPLVRKVPPTLQPLFEKTYETVTPETLSLQALQTLITELIPAIQILSGSLYLLKNDKQTLAPILNFGLMKRGREKLSINGSHPVAQSVFSALPQQYDSGNGILSICGALPESQKQAVLLLDFQSGTYQLLGESVFPIFKALALTFVDVMGQRQRS